MRIKTLGMLIAKAHAIGFGKAGGRVMLTAFVLFSAFNFGERSWNTFDPFVANDVLTPVYAQYARNLVRYPLSETRGLMVDLVGAPPQGLTLGEPRTFYSDHPSGTVWLIAVINRFLVDDPMVAARVTNIIAAISATVAMLAFVYRCTSLWPALGTTAVLLTLPLFWEHSIVANFEPPPCSSWWPRRSRLSAISIGLVTAGWQRQHCCGLAECYAIGRPISSAVRSPLLSSTGGNGDCWCCSWRWASAPWRRFLAT